MIADRRFVLSPPPMSCKWGRRNAREMYLEVSFFLLSCVQPHWLWVQKLMPKCNKGLKTVLHIYKMVMSRPLLVLVLVHVYVKLL